MSYRGGRVEYPEYLHRSVERYEDRPESPVVADVREIGGKAR